MANAGGKSLQHQIDRLLQHGTVTGLTDAELLERYLDRRDEVAFEALVRMHGPMVLGLCRRLLHDRQDVEDAFQATFLILVRKAPSLRDRTLLANWLYGVAYRVAVRARMKSSRRNAGKRPAELLDEIAADRAEPAESSDWLPILDEELTRLPEKYRGPLVLCYLNGQTHEQSAGRLGIPVGTVRSRLARGRDLLKRRLERRGVAPSVVAVALGGSPTKVALLATVPTSLVNGTLVSASRFLSLPAATASLSAGTISAISLTQGVLTAMFFSQLKVAALGILATGAVASGVALAVSSSSGTARREIVAESAPPRTAEPHVEPVQKQVIQDSPPSLEVAFADRRDSPTTVPLARGLIHELDAQLDIATRHYLLIERRYRGGTISRDEFDEARGKVELVEAKVKDLVEVFEEDRTRFELDLAKANAETAVRAARVKIASRLVERNERLDARVKGAVSEEDAAVANDQLQLAKAEEASSKADSAAAKAMIQVVDRRIEAAKALLKKAAAVAAKLPTDEDKPPTVPVPPPAR